jgi:hypothetical protein
MTSTTLSFQFSYNGFEGTGQIVGDDTGLLSSGVFNSSSTHVPIYQATDGSITFSSVGSSLIDVGTYQFKDVAALGLVPRYLATSYSDPNYDPSWVYPVGNVAQQGWSNKFNLDYLWDIAWPSVVFSNDDDSRIAGLYSNGYVMGLALYDAASNTYNSFGLAISANSSPVITSAAYDAIAGVLVVTGASFSSRSGLNNDIDASLLAITGEGGTAYTLTDSSDVDITSPTAFSVVLSATDKAALNQILNKNGRFSTGGTVYNLAAANNWNIATSGVADTTGNRITVSQVPFPVITGAAYNTSTGALNVAGAGFLSKSGAANDIDVSKLTITGQGGGTRTLSSNNVEITSGTSFSVILNSADQTALQSLLNKNGTSSSGGTTYNLAASEDWAAGADAAVVVADLSGNGITVSGIVSISSGGGGPETTSSVSDTTPADPTPADPAPAGTNIQSTDADGDGLREVITASDGAVVDGNRDGIPDVQQIEVAGLRLINDGAVGTDYGALVVSPEVRLRAVTLTAPTTDGSIPVTARGGGTVVTTTPDGITNAFAGVVSFDVTGVTPGGSTQATINFPSGLPAGSGNAYVRFNYSTNRFEEYVDAAGNPLYTFVDSDGDGVLDAVNLTLVDGDPTWDGDGSANGTVVDPGFLGSGERIITGTRRGDTLIGNVLANTLNGRKGKDWLVGDLGNDILKGSLGNDRLYGGEGADQITGGRDNDRFIYTLASDSSTSLRDTVKFGKEDRFVFSSFDGDSTTDGQQKLSFIGKQAFSGVAGELRATRTVLEADLNGDSIADFAINLRGSSLITSSNLVL